MRYRDTAFYLHIKVNLTLLIKKYCQLPRLALAHLKVHDISTLFSKLYTKTEMIRACCLFSKIVLDRETTWFFFISHLFSPFTTNPATPHPHPNIVQYSAQWIIFKLTHCELSPSCWNVWQTFLFGWRITGWNPTWMSLIKWSLAKKVLRGICFWPLKPLLFLE